MCFANAVLQVLVYCTPFQRLFIELGRLLVLGGGGGGKDHGSVNGSGSGDKLLSNTTHEVNGTGSGKSVKSQTPFIDATVEFLKEFIVVEEDKERERKKSGGGFGYGKGGKGKEKEIIRDGYEDAEDDDDEWSQSFLPTYVYEAMKEKKRFESMRVSFFFWP